MPSGPGGGLRIGCMFCGSEIDVEGTHQTTGNKGCVSPTNPAVLTVRQVTPRVVHYTDIRFVPMVDDVPGTELIGDKRSPEETSFGH
jgi:hypothetical protein